MYSEVLMSLQAVRALYEVPVMNACATYGVPVIKARLTPAAAPAKRCRMSMRASVTSQFKPLGESLETLNGTFVVELFTIKGEGPGRAQFVITEIVKALNNINTCDPHTGDTDVAYGYVGPIAGPLFDQPDDVRFYADFVPFPSDLQKFGLTHRLR